jgi:hypothetical protein
MQPDIRSQQVTTAIELDAIEARLRAEGYKLTGKESSKVLLPGEFFKTEHLGSETSFSGNGGYVITWRLFAS